MKSLVFSIATLFILVSACQSKRSFHIQDYISESSKRDEVLFQIVRHVGKLPEKKTENERFDSKLDSAHRVHLVERAYRFEAYFVQKDTHYFMVSRIAPSLYEKRQCIAGKIVFDEKGSITEFEEVFRTFKMLEPELKEKSMMLFELMIEGKDLRPYYFENANGKEYIEFPDAFNTYDKKQRRWISNPRVL
jgi:hypothetical protein